jgi:hypothetical protein
VRPLLLSGQFEIHGTGCHKGARLQSVFPACRFLKYLTCKWLALKSKAAHIVRAFSRKHYAFSFDLRFYDVTTLYFEVFEEDGLRKSGNN